MLTECGEHIRDGILSAFIQVHIFAFVQGILVSPFRVMGENLLSVPMQTGGLVFF